VLTREFREAAPAGAKAVRDFCGGCLVVSGPSKAEDPDWPETLARDPVLAGWPLVVAVDDAVRAAKSAINFLWTTFTRFEPAADIHAAETTVVRNHIAYTAPVIIDARLKPGFPEELVCDPQTAATVTRRWKEYFPRGMEMGDSDRAHLD
jgi:hypothetical protein